MLRRAGNIYKSVVTIWLALSVGSAILAVVSWEQFMAREQQGRQLSEIRRELNQITASLLELDTGERGYVITGDTNFLAPFNNALTNLPPEFASLILLVHDRPALLDGVTKLQAEAEAAISWHQEVVTTRGLSQNKAIAMVATDKLRNLMGQMQNQLGLLDKISTARQDAIGRGIRNHVVRAHLASIVAGAFALGAGLLAVWMANLAFRHEQKERELMEAKLRAEHNSEQKTALLANMSHEIRTPMNAILGFSELLQVELAEGRHKRYAQSIRTSASSLVQLINDILDMSKIESGALELRREPADPREMCDFTRAVFAEPAAKKNLKLDCHVAADVPRALLLDRIRLRQVLVNLIGNAIKFTDQGGVDVRVSAENDPEGNHATLTVEVLDTGVGIPADKLQDIFKPFVQAGAHLDKEKQGTGLGLAIVKRLTEAMGGTVTVTSAIAQGSAFRLRFPNIPISVRLPVSDRASANGDVDFDALQPATLLVVDDNKTNCDLMAGIFAGSGHRTIFALSGDQAVSRARETPPDVVLLDVRMPGMDGFETLAQIRKIPGLERVPGIAVTASTLPGAVKLLKERFSGYVQKPFTRRQLFDELSEFLPRRAANGAAASRANGAVAPAAFAPAPAELISELRRLVADPWPTICDCVAIKETRAFAQSLRQLGERWHSPALSNYADALLHDAETYAVTDLEKHLGEFAALVEQLAGPHS
ncbi:MAG: response regulator [Verrucomicrobia bacterium]|nr:response regulator [Verrucomicrobiota bacterium]MDE3099676.1 response regulator [Verrucomicrobiota bacterium]